MSESVEARPGEPVVGDEEFRCAASVIWVRRVLCVAVIVAAIIAALRADPGGHVPNGALVKGLIIAIGVTVALRIFLSTSEVSLAVTLRRADLLFERRKRIVALRIEDISALDFDPPFRRGAGWLPALVVIDRNRKRFRVPASIRSGDRLVLHLVERAGRPDLAADAEAEGLARRMERAGVIAAVGYAMAVLVLVAALL